MSVCRIILSSWLVSLVTGRHDVYCSSGLFIILSIDFFYFFFIFFLFVVGVVVVVVVVFFFLFSFFNVLLKLQLSACEYCLLV